MKRLFFLLTMLLLYGSRIIAQQNDYGKIWVQGGGLSYTSDFQGNQVVNQVFDTIYSPYFAEGHSNVCDSLGNLLLCSDGYNLYNNLAELVDDGDTLVPHKLYDYYSGYGQYPQISIFLPAGGNRYYFVITAMSDSSFEIAQNGGPAYFDLLYYNLVDMNANGGAGKVVKRMVPLMEHAKLSGTQMMACRHGNGRDWWLLKQSKDTNVVYKFRFTPDSVYNEGSEGFAEPHFTVGDWGGQSMFSDDGTKYATTCRTAYRVFLADFDRCTGTLSNPKVYNVPPLTTHTPGNPTLPDSVTQGLCFSPNGRFLYVTHFYNIHQLDLLDTNENSQWYVAAELDTSFVAFNLYTTIYPGPDHKLYIGNFGGTGGEMSVINSPDNKGVACGFCAKCLRFPHYYYHVGSMIYDLTGVTSPPCMPNYKLGAATPPCTNGIAETTYGVALTIYPNPASLSITIEYGQEGVLVLADMFGRIQKTIALPRGKNKIVVDVSELASGVYAYGYSMQGARTSGKLVIVH